MNKPGAAPLPGPGGSRFSTAETNVPAYRPIARILITPMKTLRAITFLLLSWPLAGHAAALYTETFDDDMALWGNAGGTQSWAQANGYVWVAFPEVFIPPLGHNAILAAGATSSGGAFVGDYRAAGAQVIGFDFYADGAIPAELVLELRSGTNVYQRLLQGDLDGPGVTNRIVVSLVSRTAGGWGGLGPADDAVFESVLTNVTEVFIRATRGSMPAQEYRVDNIFLDGLPAAGSSSVDPADGLVTWEGTRFGWTYSLEARTNLLLGSWVTVDTAVATNDVHSFMDADMTNQPMRVYRLLMQ